MALTRDPAAKTYPYIVTFLLNAQQKARLVAWARHQGISLSEATRRLLDQQIPDMPQNQGE